MSLWLQAATDALAYGLYEHLRVNLLPHAPMRIAGCLSRELEFAERYCRDKTKDRLFPIRFLWLWEGNEQQMFGLPPLGRSHYHPEKLLDFWERACADPQYRQEREAEGFVFDFAEKAVKLTSGWVYIGERFIEDFLEVEATLGVELLFPGPQAGEKQPAFQAFKRQHAGEENRAEPHIAADQPQE